MEKKTINRRFSIAPMMEYTDRHFRYFCRLLTKKALLYTEMVTTGAILYGHRQRILGFEPIENPIAFQIGGSNPQEMAESSKIIEDWGYNEININIGCPSSQVQKGKIGVCLMTQTNLVQKCIEQMKKKTTLPITVKTRIGVNNFDSYEFLSNFIKDINSVGIDSFTIHARKAWLKGLNPKQNREKPPLHYETVYKIKEDLPFLEIILNGGIVSLEDGLQHLNKIDGVMLGREPYRNPFLLNQIDSLFFNQPENSKTRQDILLEYEPYIAKQVEQGVKLHHITRHLAGLFLGQKKAKIWRTYINEQSLRKPSCKTILSNSLNIFN